MTARRDRLRGAWRRAVLASLGLLSPAWDASAQDQVLGLLAIPGLFGSQPCARFTPIDVRLYATPEQKSPLGSIRVDSPWTIDPAGGCDGLTVNVHRAGRAAQPLATREYAYEQPAVVVLERRDRRWVKIRLADGTAWIREPSRSEFLSLQRLLTEGLTYLTAEWDGRLAAAPGGPRHGTAREQLDEPAVLILSFRSYQRALWAQVDVLSGSPCESAAAPAAAARGWLPVHAVSGEPNLWFHSRGC